MLLKWLVQDYAIQQLQPQPLKALDLVVVPVAVLVEVAGIAEHDRKASLYT